MNKFLKIFLVVFLIIILSMFLSLKVSNFLKSGKLLNEYKDYFDKPIGEQKVETWMTFSAIKNNFKLNKDDIENVLKKDIKFKSIKGSLNDYCIENDVDCNIIVNNFNTLIQNKKSIGKKIKK